MVEGVIVRERERGGWKQSDNKKWRNNKIISGMTEKNLVRKIQNVRKHNKPVPAQTINCVVSPL